MPDLPRYQQRGTLPEQKTSMASKDIKTESSVSTAVGTLADKVAVGMEQFAKIKMANEESTAKIRAAEGIAKFNEDLTNNPTKYTPQEITNQLTDIGMSASEGMTFEIGKNEFMAEYGIMKIQAQVRANAAVRGFQITQYQELTKVNRKAYQELAPAVREAKLDVELAEGRDLGAYGSDEMVKNVKTLQMREYEKNDVYNTAPSDVKKALKMVDEMEWITDEKEKATLKAQAKDIYDRHQKMANIDSQLMSDKASTDLLKVVNDPKVPIASVIEDISGLQLQQTIDAKEAKAYINLATSARGVAPKTNPRILASLGSDMAYLAQIDKATAIDDPVEHLRKIRDIKLRIVNASNGELSPAIVSQLMLQQQGLIKGFKNIRVTAHAATQKLTKGGIWGHYGYNDANDDIKKGLPPSQWGDAFLDYYTSSAVDKETGEIDMKGVDKKALVQLIIQKKKASVLGSSIKTLTDEKTGRASFYKRVRLDNGEVVWDLLD